MSTRAEALRNTLFSSVGTGESAAVAEDALVAIPASPEVLP